MQENYLPPLVEPPPAAAVMAVQKHSTRQSIETLVVVLAVITLLSVIAGVVARLCGGRHLGGNGEHDVEGWVERNCRSCIDAGVTGSAPAPAPAPAPLAEEPKPAAEEAKKP